MPDFTEIQRIKKILNAKKNTKTKLGVSFGLSTGSTLLNLACTGDPNVGFLPGRYYFLVGDSASGKSFLALTCLAEAARNKCYDKYSLVFDNAEDGALMDMERYFGKDMAKRVAPPTEDKNGPVYSTTIEEFYYHMDDLFSQNKPFIYILDSMDSLSSDSELEKFQEQKNAYRKGRDIPGSYGDGKAKANSSGLRKLIPRLRGTGSILIIISQTRDNVGTFSFDKKTRSGGHALRFYASLELWSSIKGKIRKTVKGQEEHLGVICKVQVKKNRITGRERSIEIPIYYSTGIDDTGSCVNFLVERKHWSKDGSVIHAKEFGYKGSTEFIIEKVEKKEEELQELRKIVTNVWQEIEDACEVHRRMKYS